MLTLPKNVNSCFILLTHALFQFQLLMKIQGSVGFDNRIMHLKASLPSQLSSHFFLNVQGKICGIKYFQTKLKARRHRQRS